jgi:predicted metal-dependent HD superfamily phosphohydrolase
MTNGEPAWLNILRDNLRAATRDAAAEFWPSGDAAFFNYRVEHVRQVERDALALLRAVGGDRDVVLAAAWVHDRAQPMFSGKDHEERAATWAEEHLAETGFPPEKAARVAEAVRLHRSSITPVGAIPDELHEARILWDADKLAHLGAAETVLRVLNAIAVDRRPSNAAPKTVRLVAERLAPLVERPLRPERFYFQISRRWAGDRFDAQRTFTAALLAQLGLEPADLSDRDKTEEASG